MNYLTRIVSIMLITIFLVSCHNENNMIDTAPKPIQSFYTNEAWNADRLEMLRSDVIFTNQELYSAMTSLWDSNELTVN